MRLVELIREEYKIEAMAGQRAGLRARLRSSEQLGLDRAIDAATLAEVFDPVLADTPHAE